MAPGCSKSQLQTGIDKLGGSGLRWREHGVSRPVMRNLTVRGCDIGSTAVPSWAERALRLHVETKGTCRLQAGAEEAWMLEVAKNGARAPGWDGRNLRITD